MSCWSSVGGANRFVKLDRLWVNGSDALCVGSHCSTRYIVKKVSKWLVASTF